VTATIDKVKPWVALAVGVVLVGVGLVTGNMTYVALGGGAIGLQGASHA
jgi:hypothetical protein